MEKQRVLIVDDEPRSQKLFSEILESVVNFKIASTGQEALELAKSFEPDLVLLDIIMPGISGFELCESIRGQPALSNVKIIFVSGRTMLDDKLHGYKIGADDYVSKPFSPQELLAKVKVFLRLSAVERELKDLNKFLEKGMVDKSLEILSTHAKLSNASNMSMLGEVAAGLATEMKAPLAGIQSASSALMVLSESPKPRKEIIKKHAKTLLDSSKSISNLIQGLSSFARDAEHDPFEMVPLKRIIDDTLVLCREKMRISDIEIKMNAIPEDFHINCQPVQISHVLLNLINNAFDAIQFTKHRWVAIDAKKDKGVIELSVTDSGNGIPAEIHPKLFQPFFTTKRADATNTGLGLSLSKRIIDAHDGKIFVDKASQNTRFVVRLPAADH